MEDCKQILCELFSGAERNFARNHDPPTVAADKPFKKVVSEPGQSVLVGNHNFELFSRQSAFQYGVKPFSL